MQEQFQKSLCRSLAVIYILISEILVLLLFSLIENEEAGAGELVQ